ncbi:MAG: MarR family transcriptional regulator [Desulfobacteraceae bacterium]|nr:MAG: MarR family transcriptional regulator [Desulfobacteraceae bacterium]
MNPLYPEDYPFFLITRAALSVTSMLKKFLTKNELPEIKPSYLGALMCLWANDSMDEMLSKLGSEGGMKLTDLGRCAGVEPSTITGLVDRMEQDGLVYRSNVPEDRRALKANLSEKGMQMRSSVLQAMDEMTHQAFAGIAPEEMETVKKVLRKVLENAK